MSAEPILPIRPAPDSILANSTETLRDRPDDRSIEGAPLLVDIAGLSALLQRSPASLYRDDAAGRLPAGLKLGSSKRWRYSEIVAWVEAGMPDRKTWQAMRAARNAWK
jgi:predicted DNA-binding transcriptional regulator AlpA